MAAGDPAQDGKQVSVTYRAAIWFRFSQTALAKSAPLAGSKQASPKRHPTHSYCDLTPWCTNLASPFHLGTAGFEAETRKCLPDLGRRNLLRGSVGPGGGHFLHAGIGLRPKIQVSADGAGVVGHQGSLQARVTSGTSG